MKILNLGCGNKTSDNPSVTNIDWSISLKIKTNPMLKVFSKTLLNGDRAERASKISKNIIVHDLSKGIPFPPDSIDVVYHSHMLEHIDREGAREFLVENYRVLKAGGILRVVIPDLEQLCRNYLKAREETDSADEINLEEYEHNIEEIIEQCVRVEAFGSSNQKQPRRFIENLILGDARRRGETHQWMYDRINLSEILKRVGFKKVMIKKYNESDIPGWSQLGLDTFEDGKQYKPNSLYVEAIK